MYKIYILNTVSILELYHHFTHMSTVTNAREYRKIYRKEVTKTMAHRKQIRLSGPHKTGPIQLNVDEVQQEPDDDVSLCAHCSCESTGLAQDAWILCDEYVKQIELKLLNIILIINIWYNNYYNKYYISNMMVQQ